MVETVGHSRDGGDSVGGSTGGRLCRKLQGWWRLRRTLQEWWRLCSRLDGVGHSRDGEDYVGHFKDGRDCVGHSRDSEDYVGSCIRDKTFRHLTSVTYQVGQYSNGRRSTK